jgi:hypothetical protein
MLRLESSKSGAKIIHLAGAAIDLLAAEREWASDNAKCVFPAARPDGDVDELSREWRRIRKATSIGDVRAQVEDYQCCILGDDPPQPSTVSDRQR